METVTSNLQLVISICIGIGLAASAGFRLFVPLLALSIASYLGVIPLNHDWQWAGSLTAIVVLSIAVIIELIAYYIPYIDNLLDSITIPLATIAGTLVMVSVVSDLDPVYTWALAIIAGGGTAAGIASTTSAARLTSTATTAGVGNPIVSTAEMGMSTLLSFISIIAPIFAVFIVVFIFILIKRWYKRWFKSISLSRKRTT